MPRWTIPNKFPSSVEGEHLEMVPCPLRTGFVSIFDHVLDLTIGRVLSNDHYRAVLN